MALRLAAGLERRLDGLDPEVQAGARALGLAVAAELGRLRPGLMKADDPDGPAPEAVLVALELDREPEPDAASLTACVAAHSAYVASRGHADGVSLGALALARILVWASRAAMLGPAPKVVWVGPSARRPDPAAGQHELGARCAVEVGERTREARALALVAAPG